MTAQKAWELLATGQAKRIGVEPYVFMPADKKEVAAICQCGWGDGENTIDFYYDEFDYFAETFSYIYPEDTHPLVYLTN